MSAKQRRWMTKLFQIATATALILGMLSSSYWTRAEVQSTSPQAPANITLVFLPLISKNFQPAWVIGRVSIQGSGVALAEAQVCSQNGECATTDAQGDYRINLSAGWKQLTAQKEGYTPATTSLQVSALQTRGVDFALLPARNFSQATFQGTVKDAQTQTPLSETTVCTHLNQCAITGQNGVYTLNVDVLGQFELRAEKEGYRSLTKSATAVNGATVTVDFALSSSRQWQGARIEGTVVDSSRAAYEAKLGGVSLCTQFNECGTTNPNGYYKIALTSADWREVTAQKEGFYTIAKGIQPQEGQTVTLNFALSPYISNLDARIVVTWDATPKFGSYDNDLDAYLYIEHQIGDRVIYFDANGEFLSSRLIRDEREGSGPETVDIIQFEQSDRPTRYLYGVYHANYLFSNKTIPTLSELGAQVCFYTRERLARCYSAPPGEKEFWFVFELVQEGDGFNILLRNCLADGIPEIVEDGNGNRVVGVSFPSCP